MTSSWFFLSTLNYDARSTTHQILTGIRGTSSNPFKVRTPPCLTLSAYLLPFITCWSLIRRHLRGSSHVLEQHNNQQKSPVRLIIKSVIFPSHVLQLTNQIWSRISLGASAHGILILYILILSPHL